MIADRRRAERGEIIGKNGATIGALLGNRIDVGGSRTVNTIIGGAAGAVLGRAIDRGSVRCD